MTFPIRTAESEELVSHPEDREWGIDFPPGRQGARFTNRNYSKEWGWLPQKLSYLLQNMASLTPVSPTGVTYDEPHEIVELLRSIVTVTALESG